MRKRSVGINGRVSVTEKRKMAKRCGLSLSEYLRQRALGYEPGSLFFTHRLLWNNGSGICQLFLYRINYSSANSTTNLASVAAMASWSLFSKFVFCSILMTWYFTVDGSMPSSFAISL